MRISARTANTNAATGANTISAIKATPNKIPLLNQFKWNLVAGVNTFYVNNNNYYVEGFVGLENIFKIFRIDFITATQSASGNNFGVRMGLGGVLSGAVQVNR